MLCSKSADQLQMDVDQTALIFIVEYYEMLANDVSSVENVYDDGAKVVIYDGNEPLNYFVHGYSRYLPSGPRSILSCDGQELQSHLFIHVKSLSKGGSQQKRFDELFVCSLTDMSMLIQYHSIHIDPFVDILPPPALPIIAPSPKPSPPPPPKPVEPAVEVDDVENLDGKLSVYAFGIPFNHAPADFLPILSTFGQVTKYCQAKGQLVAQYSNFEFMHKAIAGGSRKWEGRDVVVMRLSRTFHWR